MVAGTAAFNALKPIEPVVVNLLRGSDIDSQSGGPYDNPICPTGPPGYIGRRNRFLGIDSIPGLQKRLQIQEHEDFSLPSACEDAFKSRRCS